MPAGVISLSWRKKAWHENNSLSLLKQELKTCILYASSSTTIDDDGLVLKQETEIIFLQGDKEFFGNRPKTCILYSSLVITKHKIM